jgi:mannosyl-3-phosphoglycerate phosphatase
VIAVSSKTRAEIVVIRRQLGITAPFISENGGGIFFEKGSFGALEPLPETIVDQGLCKLALGAPYEDLVDCLREIGKELGWNIRGFVDMSLQEISQRTGLNESAARLARQREFDEPFVVVAPQSAEEGLLSEAARKRGYIISVGGRFYHLHGKNEKGHAVDVIRSLYVKLYGEVTTVALGDSPNDFPMLQRADIPVLVRSNREFTALEETILHLKRTREKGPRGWNSAVLDILDNEEA